MTKLTDAGIKTVTLLANADLIYNVDVSDTTDDPAGTSAKVTYQNLQNEIYRHAHIANKTTLENVTGYAGGDIVYMQGYTTTGDGGEGFFWLDSTGSPAGAAEGGLIIDSADGTNYYWRRILEKKTVTPQMWGATADGSTEDTTALNAAFDSLTNTGLDTDEVFLPKGTYITDGGLEISGNDKKVRGEGELKLKDFAGTGSGFGILRVSGDRNRIESITIRGNTANPPSWNPGTNLYIDGNFNIIDGVKLYDARSSGASSQQNNIHTVGNGNIVQNCYSEGAYYSLYQNGGNNAGNQFKNCIGRRSANTLKGFNSTGGSSADGPSLVVDGLDLDDILQMDWASENSPKLVESVRVTNCTVVIDSAYEQSACKIAHARHVFMQGNHFESQHIRGEGLIFGERLYDVYVDQCYIRGGGGDANSSSHIQSFAEGSRHRNINNFHLTNCTVGGTKNDPTTGTWDVNAIDVNAFKAVIESNNISQYTTSAININPEEVGVINMTQTTPPGTPSDKDTYILGAAPSGWGGSPSQYDFATYDLPNTQWLFETPEYGTRVWDADTGDFYYFEDQTAGWVACPYEMYGLYIRNNTMTGFRDSPDTLYAVNAASGVGLTAFIQPGISRYFDNRIINLGTGGTAIAATNNLNPGLLEPSDTWTHTSSGALYVRGSSQLDSTSGALTMTLGSGHHIGQMKTIVMTDATNSSTVSVTNHETSDPEVFTFDAVDEYLTLVWTGTEWATVSGTATV